VGVEGPDGKLSQWPARIVATDASHDLAVLQIDAPPDTLQPIKVPNLSPYHS
jgi:S1-C subfamily serine protease